MSFKIGITPDFYTDAQGKFEHVLDQQLGAIAGIDCDAMPPQPGKLATPGALNQFDAIMSLALKITPESLKGVDRLAIVARWGVGYDMIDVNALTHADVLLAITPNGVRRSVAEAILAFIFALIKNLPLQDRLTRSGGWRGDLTRLGRNIPGHVLGSVGCGNIAQELFRLARPLGFARLLACDPYVKPDQVASLGVDLVDMDTVFRESDFVTVNTLLNASTRNLVGKKQFDAMKPTAYFINTARGGIVDHAALVAALRDNKIAGAGIDVFPVEPPPSDDPLFSLDNVIVAPHALAWTVEIMRDNGIEACQNVLAVSKGDLPTGIVNKEVLDRPGFRRKLDRFRQTALLTSALLMLGAAASAQAPPPSMVAGIPVNYEESLAGNYDLPDPLLLANGKRVRDAKTWNQKRRPEILRLFEENQFGRAPGRPQGMSKAITFDVFDKGTPAFEGKALRKQVTIYFSADKNGPKQDMVVYLPANAAKPVPLLLCLNFAPNASTFDDPGIKLGERWGRDRKKAPAQRGAGIGRMKIDDLLARGFAVAGIYYGDIDPDFLDGARLGVRSLY
ncbi:MAG: NAD(P)-dependent oxidoreductase, partial [Bryobacteraceae bacterium]